MERGDSWKAKIGATKKTEGKMVEHNEGRDESKGKKTGAEAVESMIHEDTVGVGDVASRPSADKPECGHGAGNTARRVMVDTAEDGDGRLDDEGSEKTVSHMLRLKRLKNLNI